jgi:hypothetical protein
LLETIEPGKQYLLGNGSVTLKNGISAGNNFFGLVPLEAL